MASSSGSGGEGGAQVKNKAGATAEDDDSLMDYRPQRALKADELASVKTAVTVKLSELMDEPCDEVFPEYITVMISNGKTIREICSQLEDLLTSGIATLFCKWLGKHLRGVETSSAKASSQEKTTSYNDTAKSSKAKSSVPSKTVEGAGSGKGKGKEGGRSSGQAKKGKVVSSTVLASSPGAKGKGSRERSPSSSRSHSRSTFSSRSLDRDRSRGRDSMDRGRGSRGRDWDHGRNDDRDWPRARVRNDRDRGRDHRHHSFNNRARDRSRDNNNMRDRTIGTSYRVNAGGLDRYGPDPRDRDHHHRASPRDRDSRDRFRLRNGSFSMERKESFTRERRASFSKGDKEAHPRDIRGESRDRGKRDHSRDRNRDHRDMEREKKKGFAALAQPRDAGHGKGLEVEVDRVEGGSGGERGDGAGGERALRARVKSSVSVVPSPRTEEPKPAVQGSISVVGGSAKEEMDLQKEKAKLPDLRMIIQERRRAAEAAEKAVDEGEPVEADEVHKPKGRGAEGRGNMRGFSPERKFPDAPEQSQNGKSGVKRGLGVERPPGARLLSSAMMQSVQSVGVKAPPLDGGAVAEGNGGGDKRRKSADGARYVKVTSSGKRLGAPVDDQKNDRQIDDWAGDERDRAPAEGQRLRITTPSSLATPASKANQHATTSALQRTIDSTWRPWQSGGEEDDDDLEEADGEGGYLAYGAYGGRENARHMEADASEGWDDARSQRNASHVASPATAYFTAKQRAKNDSSMWTNNPDIQQNSEDMQGGNTPAAENDHGVSSTVRGNMTWTNPNLKRQQPHQQQGTHRADWAQSMQGNGKGSSPSEAAAKWATALRAAAAVNGTASPGANNAVTVVSEESLALLASLSAEEAVAAAGLGAAQHMGTFGRGRGRGGRNSTWVRGGQIARGRGRGRDSTAATGWASAIGRGGGRVSRGGRGGRGRGIAVPVKSLGRGGGWHSTGTAVADVGEGEVEGGRGRGRGKGRGAGVLPGRGVPRETWNKVWVRPDLVQGGDTGGVGEKRAAGGEAPAVDA